ncbi:hypothetical protein AB0J48_08410 [Nocardia salmonicida]|uniref:hypothetical protein n=1 Tax=Nocardia salmonicida TaxID=53431 RepID=UPI0034499DE9
MVDGSANPGLRRPGSTLARALASQRSSAFGRGGPDPAPPAAATIAPPPRYGNAATSR